MSIFIPSIILPVILSFLWVMVNLFCVFRAFRAFRNTVANERNVRNTRLIVDEMDDDLHP